MANSDADKSTAERAAWFVAGFGVGSLGILLLAKDFTADWVGAAGTWFGSIATVLALLWAVQSFRTDQRRRDADAALTAAEKESQRLAEYDALVVEATLVRPRLEGGGGFEGSTMTSMHLTLTNDSQHTVTVDWWDLDRRIRPKKTLPRDVRVEAGKSRSVLIDIEDLRAAPSDFSGRPLDRFDVRIDYRRNGRMWTISSEQDDRARELQGRA